MMKGTSNSGINPYKMFYGSPQGKHGGSTFNRSYYPWTFAVIDSTWKEETTIDKDRSNMAISDTT